MRLTLGLHLIRQGLISPEQLIDALDFQEQRRPRIGQLALRERKMSVRQVLEVLSKQTESKEPFGTVAVALGYLTAADVDHLLIDQRRQTPRLGDILVLQNALDPESLERELAAVVRAGLADDQIVL